MTTTTLDSRKTADAAMASAAPPPAPTGAGLRHALALAKRSLIKTWRTPEALIDVTLQPIIFLLMFTYIFGGAIAGGSQHDYLQFLLPGLLGQSIAMGGIALGQNLNADIEKACSTGSARCPSPGPRRWSVPSSPTSPGTWSYAV